MATSTRTVTVRSALDRSGKRRIVQVIVWFILSGVVLFVAAGTVDWPEAWILLGGGMVLAGVMSVLILRRNLEVINERGRKSDQTKGWDRLLAAFMTPIVLGYMVIAGLDHPAGLVLCTVVGKASLTGRIGARYAPSVSRHARGSLSGDNRADREGSGAPGRRGRALPVRAPCHVHGHPFELAVESDFPGLLVGAGA